jgi:hypothetical protein
VEDRKVFAERIAARGLLGEPLPELAPRVEGDGEIGAVLELRPGEEACGPLCLDSRASGERVSVIQQV